MLSLVAALVLASAPQQQQDPNRLTDFLLSRMKERLRLTDEQAAKVREILVKDGEDRSKMDEARTAKINELLNDEQKRQYEEMRRGFGGFGQGGAGGGRQFQFGGGQGGGFGRGMGQLNLDDLKRELTLTDEQAGKISPLLEEFNANAQKRIQELQQGGFQGLDIPGEIQKFQDGLKALTDKVKEHLMDEQKTKLDALVERTTGFLRFVPLLAGGLQQGGGGGNNPFGGGRRGNPEERVRRAVEALKIEKEEERNAIRDLIAKVVQAQAALEEYPRSIRDALQTVARSQDLSDQALEDKIKEVTEERKKREQTLSNLQKELAEVVTNRQEIELMLQGILK